MTVNNSVELQFCQQIMMKQIIRRHWSCASEMVLLQTVRKVLLHVRCMNPANGVTVLYVSMGQVILESCSKHQETILSIDACNKLYIPW